MGQKQAWLARPTALFKRITSSSGGLSSSKKFVEPVSATAGRVLSTDDQKATDNANFLSLATAHR